MSYSLRFINLTFSIFLQELSIYLLKSNLNDDLQRPVYHSSPFNVALIEG